MNLIQKEPDIVVMQEYLLDPFIIKDILMDNILPNGKIINRKINLRIYIFTVVVYSNGYCYKIYMVWMNFQQLLKKMLY